MNLSSDNDRLQNNVLENLSVAKDWDLLQVFRIAKLIAQNGNRLALELMKNELKYDQSWNCFLGAEEIIETEGLEGLLFVTEVIGKKILSDTEYYEDDSILECSYESIGKDNVLTVLEKASKTNIRIKAYIDSVNQLNIIREENYKNRQEYSYKEIRQIINGNIKRKKD